MKRLVYMYFVVFASTGLSFAKTINSSSSSLVKTSGFNVPMIAGGDILDTTRNKKQNQDADDKRKIKEIAKARRQAKPEKLITLPPTDTLGSKLRIKARRQRRPEGLERPPEIPRRNNN